MRNSSAQIETGCGNYHKRKQARTGHVKFNSMVIISPVHAACSQLGDEDGTLVPAIFSDCPASGDLRVHLALHPVHADPPHA